MSSAAIAGSIAPLETAVRFFNRFAGNQRSHGYHFPGTTPDEHGKIEGRSVTEYEPPTVELWERHLAGTYSLGIVPILDSGKCRFGAIDIDEYALHTQGLKALAGEIERLHLPLILCKTKSGGAHLFYFASEPTRASLVRNKLMEWSGVLGHSGVEIFPKQSRLAGPKDYGNWINMPYFGGEDTARYALAGDRSLTPEEFLDLADKMAMSEEDLKDCKPQGVASSDAALLAGGPPCLQCLAQRGVGASEGRNNALYQYGVYLRKRFGEVTSEAMHEFNIKFYQPPLGDNEVNKVVKSFAKGKNYQYKCHEPPMVSVCEKPVCLTRQYGVGAKEHNDGAPSADDDPAVADAIAAINARYGLVKISGKIHVLEDKRRDPPPAFDEPPEKPYDLLSLADFKLDVAPIKVLYRGEEVSIGQIWPKHKDRNFLKKFGYWPGEDGPPNAFNADCGFRTEPREGPGADLFLDLIRQIVHGNELYYRWVISFFAQLFQNPRRKLGIALALRGPQGVGKTMIGKVIGWLLGWHYLIVNNPRYVVGNFNEHLASLRLLQPDEAFWAGDHAAEGVIKDLVTNDRFLIEPKYVNPYVMPNYVRIFITSNKSWVVPAGWDERRFCMLDANEEILRRSTKEKRAYFKAIFDQLDHEDGYAALLHYLLTFPVNEDELREVLPTRALAEQKVHSFSPEEQWWADVLAKGILPGDRNGNGSARTDLMYRHYRNYVRSLRGGRVLSEVALGLFLRKVCRGFTKGETSTYEGPSFSMSASDAAAESGKRRNPVRTFPSVRECRTMFVEATRGAIEWEVEVTEWGVDETDYRDEYL
jgi:hypothetical protein